MKLLSKPIEAFWQLERRHEKLTDKFLLFKKQMDFFSEPRSGINGVVNVSRPENDQLYFTATYRSVTVGFRMLCEINDSNSGSARVVCTLEQPKFTALPVILGSFGFDAQGFADFERSDDQDPVDMEPMAAEIALHFLHLGLKHSAV